MIKLWYRIVQLGMDIGCRFLPWRKPELVQGCGCSKEIPFLLKKSGAKKVMVVTGRHVGKSLAPAILDNIRAEGLECVHFDGVEANPSTTTVEKIVSLYNENNCDSFLAIGGGSPMDAAKAAAARVVKPKKSLSKMAGLFKVLHRLPTFIAVPTTAGTGSETTVAAIITDAESHRKYAIMDLSLVPRYAVLDPELTRGLPPHTTAATGMDALTHAVEAYLCCMNTTAESLRMAEEAAATVFEYLERAYSDGNDMEARAAMLEASFKAGYAFTRSGVGNVHAIAHTLGGLYNVAHGLANAVILPIVLEDYMHFGGKPVINKLAKLSELCGIADADDKEAAAKAFVEAVYAMNRRMEIPEGFNQIQDEDIPKVIDWALAEANPTYPVPVIYDRAHCRAVIEKIKARG